jgi:hypothetical protein
MATVPLPSAVEQVLHADSLECARRASRYKFGRLRNRRIVALLRRAAAEAGESLPHTDEDLLDTWFAQFAAYVDELKAAARAPRT